MSERHGAACACDACMDSDERLFTVWHGDDDAPITCPTCGAAVESDALARQTMADGELMWPRPFCRACLLAGLRRLDAELKRQPGKDGDA